MTRAGLDQLIGTATSLRERLDLGWQGEPAGENDRWSRWTKNAAQTNQEKLLERLAWDGLDVGAAQRLVNTVQVTLPGQAPWWAAMAETLVNFVSAPLAAVEPRAPEAPFVHAIAPIARFGISLLRQRTPLTGITPAIIETLEGNLERKIAYVADQTLAQEFRAGGCKYDTFVADLLAGGWERIFVRYPVLARLLAIRITYWINDIAEFFEHLAGDRAGIASRFGQGRDLGLLVGLKSSLSDPHHQGRSVEMAEFESGLKILYKPKPLGLDLAWKNLLDWVSAHPGAPRLKGPGVWMQPGYGWVEFIPYAACQDDNELRQYYERAGALVAIIYLLQGTDFHFEIRSEDVECGHGMLVEPSYDTVAAIVRRMSAADLTRQVGLIRATYEAKVAKPSEGEAIQRTEIRLSPMEPSTGDLVEQARRIARELEKNAVRELDGSVNWLGLDVVPSSDRFRLTPLGLSLYAGVSGVAVFLSALHRMTGEAQWERLARAAAETVRNRLTKDVDPDQARTYAAEEGIGGARGLASTVYALTRISSLLDDPGYLDDARRIALLLTPERIASDATLDPMGGAAGAILGILPLWEKIQDEQIMGILFECGQHLVRSQTSVDGRAWPSRLAGRPALTGMSHGASGIAYALLRLHKARPEPAFLEAALRGIDYETSLFSRQARVWPDLRFAETDPARFERTGSWCSGAPGIGLARIATWKLRPTPALAQDVHHALAHVLNRPLPATDTLCCGAFGVLELPLLATESLGREELLSVARRRAGAVIDEAAATGGFNLFGVESRAFHPGFHRGASGIGYQLLRLADPAALPSVLVWD